MAACAMLHMGIYKVDQTGWVIQGTSPALVTDKLETSVQVMFDAQAQPDSQKRLRYVAWPEQENTSKDSCWGQMLLFGEKKVGFNCPYY